MIGTKIGTIYMNEGNGEGFVLWDEDQVDKLDGLLGVDVLNDISVDVDDLLNDAREGFSLEMKQATKKEKDV